MLTVEFLSNARAIPAALWEACFPAPLEGVWWYEALEQCGLEEQFQFSYALLHQNGIAVGIAPLFVMNVSLRMVIPAALLSAFDFVTRFCPSMAYQRTLFVGSPCADEGTVGLLENVDRLAALIALQSALKQRMRVVQASMLIWKDFPAQDEAIFLQLASVANLFRAESFPGTLVDLPGPGVEDYYAALSRSHRSNLKRKLKKSRAILNLNVEVWQELDSETLDQIFAVFWQTYQKATTRFEELTPAFFREISAAPCTRFVVLRHTDSSRIAAFMLCFMQGERVINKFIGLDYQLPEQGFLYFRLWDAVVEWASSCGIKSIQSGQTGYSAKLLLEHRLQPLTNWCTHRNQLIQAIYRIIARKITWETLDPDLACHLAAHPATASVHDH